MKTFISHSSQDKWFVKELNDLLDRLGIPYWYDKNELSVGDNFFERIHEGLEECSHLIAIISRNSIESHWVKQELKNFFRKFVEGGKSKVFPVLLDDVWNKVPSYLQDLLYADFRGSTAGHLNKEGIRAIEKIFLGTPIFEETIFKSYSEGKNQRRLVITLPQGKTKKEINQMAKRELDSLRFKLAGQKVIITGRITYTLALMVGAYLGNICKSISAYDPKAEGEDEFVPIFLPS